MEEYCSVCNGSGEGMADGTTCQVCKGSGVVKIESDDFNEPDYDDRAEEAVMWGGMDV